MGFIAESVTLLVSRRMASSYFANRFVSLDESNHERVRPIVQYNDIVFGVLAHDYATGKEASIKCGGHLKVLAGDTIAVGDEIVTNLDGFGVKRGTAAQALYNVVGRALTSASENEFFILDFRPYTVFGSNAS